MGSVNTLKVIEAQIASLEEEQRFIAARLRVLRVERRIGIASLQDAAPADKASKVDDLERRAAAALDKLEKGLVE